MLASSVRAALRRAAGATAASASATASRRGVSTVAEFASIDVNAWNGAKPHTVQNIVAGQWKGAKASEVVPDCMNGEAFMNVPLTSVSGSAKS